MHASGSYYSGYHCDIVNAVNGYIGWSIQKWIHASYSDVKTAADGVFAVASYTPPSLQSLPRRYGDQCPRRVSYLKKTLLL